MTIIQTTPGLEPSPLIEADLQSLERKTDLTLDDYLVWTMSAGAADSDRSANNNSNSSNNNNNNGNCVHDFLSLLFQVCHIVLGLRPSTKTEEGKIVKGWLEREERKGLSAGDLWYLVSSSWWQGWKEYVAYDGGGGGGGGGGGVGKSKGGKQTGASSSISAFLSPDLIWKWSGKSAVERGIMLLAVFNSQPPQTSTPFISLTAHHLLFTYFDSPPPPPASPPPPGSPPLASSAPPPPPGSPPHPL